MSSGVAVVIVNFDGERLLPDCLAALAAQTLAPDEIVVADNGSRDASLALLRDRYPHVRALASGTTSASPAARTVARGRPRRRGSAS